ncbi:Synaptobrevin [Folsomia candida]|uniref:Synaptobrevin n=1 Tax=Folsomia candida TaxID=158441 RepID=A0A226DSD8_FOLCA|nr:Synaptobrevin [Folsomia candida]
MASHVTRDATGAGPSSSGRADQERVVQMQAQVNEVVGVMRNNVALMLERDQKLSELDLRAGMRHNFEGKLIITKHVDALEQGAHQFERQAVSLKRKFWWQNLKMMILLVVVIIVVLIVIGFAIWGGSKGSGSSNNNPAPSNRTVSGLDGDDDPPK